MRLSSSIESMVFEFQDFVQSVGLAQNFGNSQTEEHFRAFCLSLPGPLSQATVEDYKRYMLRFGASAQTDTSLRETMKLIARFQTEIQKQSDFLGETHNPEESSYEDLLRRFSSSALADDNEPFPEISTGMLNESFKPLAADSDILQKKASAYVKPHRRRESLDEFNFGNTGADSQSSPHAPNEFNALLGLNPDQHVSQAMPSKTNPGILRPATAEPSTAINEAATPQRPLSAQARDMTPKPENIFGSQKTSMLSPKPEQTPQKAAERQRARTVQLESQDAVMLDFFAAGPIAEAKTQIKSPEHEPPQAWGELNLQPQSALDILNERKDPNAGLQQPDISFSRIARVNSSPSESIEVAQNIQTQETASLKRVVGVDFDFSDARKMRPLSQNPTDRAQDLKQATAQVQRLEQRSQNSTKHIDDGFIFENQYLIDMKLDNAEAFETKSFKHYLAQAPALGIALALLATACLFFANLGGSLSLVILVAAVLVSIIAAVLLFRSYRALKQLTQQTPVSALGSYLSALQCYNFVAAYRYLAQSKTDTAQELELNDTTPQDLGAAFNNLSFPDFVRYWHHHPYNPTKGALNKIQAFLHPIYPKDTKTVLGSIENNAVILLFEDPEQKNFFLAALVRLKGAWYLSQAQLLARQKSQE